MQCDASDGRRVPLLKERDESAAIYFECRSIVVDAPQKRTPNVLDNLRSTQNCKMSKSEGDITCLFLEILLWLKPAPSHRIQVSVITSNQHKTIHRSYDLFPPPPLPFTASSTAEKSASPNPCSIAATKASLAANATPHPLPFSAPNSSASRISFC